MGSYMNRPIGAAAGSLRGNVRDGDGEPVKMTVCVSLGEFPDENGHDTMLIELELPGRGPVLVWLDFEATHAARDAMDDGFHMLANALSDD